MREYTHGNQWKKTSFTQHVSIVCLWPFQYPIRRDFVKSHKVSMLLDFRVDLINCCEIWQSSWAVLRSKLVRQFMLPTLFFSISDSETGPWSLVRHRTSRDFLQKSKIDWCYGEICLLLNKLMNGYISKIFVVLLESISKCEQRL